MSNEESVVAKSWHILGAGAQGLLWAHALAHDGQQPVLITQTHVDAKEFLYEREANKVGFNARCISIDALPYGVERLLVTVKANQLRAALSGIRAQLADDACIVLLQNGIGAESIARAILPESSTLILGSSTHGSFRCAPFHVIHAGFGAVLLGSTESHLSEAPISLKPLLRCGLNVSWEPNINQVLWHKLAINACINPLSALLNCKNGELLTHPTAQHWLSLLIKETSDVLEQVGYPLSPESLAARIQNVLKITAENYNSMQQDYISNKETEFAFITGTLLNSARVHGVSVPAHIEIQRCMEQRATLTASATEN